MAISRVVSVFGSHAPRPGSPDYETARKLGGLLGSAGFAVATGGYEGTMSAVSQGASEAGGQVIGVTCAQVERSRGAVLNEWVNEEIKYESLSGRLQHLVRNNDGMIVLPGGIGTLSEFALAWSYLQVGEMAPRPLVIMGSLWANWFKSFVHPDHVLDEHVALVSSVESPAAAVTAITAALEAKVRGTTTAR